VQSQRRPNRQGVPLRDPNLSQGSGRARLHLRRLSLGPGGEGPRRFRRRWRNRMGNGKPGGGRLVEFGDRQAARRTRGCAPPTPLRRRQWFPKTRTKSRCARNNGLKPSQAIPLRELMSRLILAHLRPRRGDLVLAPKAHCSIRRRNITKWNCDHSDKHPLGDPMRARVV